MWTVSLSRQERVKKDIQAAAAILTKVTVILTLSQQSTMLQEERLD